MQSVNDIVNRINPELNLPERSVRYGLATSIIVDGQEKLPVIIDKDGEGKYIGIDGDYSVMLYHKMNSVQSSLRPGSSYGNSRGDRVSAFSMSMIVFLNRRKYSILPDQLMHIIQESMPEALDSTDYKSITVSFNNAILNDLQVFMSEYATDRFRMLPEYNLFQINYTLGMTFKKGCFNTCPEDKH